MGKKNLTVSYKMALSGIFTALALVSLMLSYVVPTATYACPALAGVMLIPIVIEVGKSWAVCAYAAASLLSFFLIPDKEIALCFTAFFGYYPITKAIFERHLPTVFSWIAKIAVFAISMVGVFFVTIYVLGISRDSFTVFGLYIPWILLLAGTVIFVIYDFALTKVIKAYVHIWRKKIFKRIL